MKLCIFGGWPDGSWRELLLELERLGNEVVYFAPASGEQVEDAALEPYVDFERVHGRARRELMTSDAAIVLSDSPDALEASALVLGSNVARRVFCDLDTPLTLRHLGRGQPVPWIGDGGLAGFDLVLSSAGGSFAAGLQERLGAARVVPFHPWVEQRLLLSPPELRGDERLRCTLSLLTTSASDPSTELLELLYLQPARVRLRDRFLLVREHVEDLTRLPENLTCLTEFDVGSRAGLYASSRITLHLGGIGMSSVLQAVACGAAVIAQPNEAVRELLSPGDEVLEAYDGVDVLAALSLDGAELDGIVEAARDRLLTQHTAHQRARQLTSLIGRGAALYLVGATA